MKKFLMSLATASLVWMAMPERAIADTTNPNGNGTGSSPSGQLVPSDGKAIIQASTTTDEKTGSIQATLNLGDSGTSQTLLSLTGQTPVGQSQNYTNVSTLDGLTKSTSIAFKFSYLTAGSDIATPAQQALQQKQRELDCERAFRKIAPASTLKQSCDHTVLQYAASGVWDTYQQLIEKRSTDDKYAQSPGADSGQILRNQRDEMDMERQILVAIQAAGISSDDKKSIEKITNEELEDVSRVPVPLWMFSFNGKVGYEQHAYYDPTSLTKLTENKTPYQVGGETTYVFISGVQSLNLSFNYQQSYQDADMGTAQTKCHVAVSLAATCVTGFIGAPSSQGKALLELDYRYIGTLPVVDIPFGINPGVTYDADSHAKAFQFPLYLMTDSSNNLTGGIRYDWTSTNHLSTVGLFVAAAFSVFGD